MKKTFLTQKLINGSILTYVALLAIATMILTMYDSDTGPFNVHSVVHVSFTTGFLLLAASITMVSHRPQQLYFAGALCALTVVSLACTLAKMKLPFVLLFRDDASVYDYPSLGEQVGFLAYSFAILFKSKELAVTTFLLGLVAVVGQLLAIPILYWMVLGTGMSSIMAITFVMMSIWLVAEYFPDFDFRKYIPTFSKLTSSLLHWHGSKDAA